MSKNENREATIRQLYTELNKQGSNGEYEKALKSANKILALDQNETKALQCKLVCLIQLSKFEEVLKFLDRTQPAYDCTFERAYCQYRLNQPEAAYKTIQESGVKPLPPNLKELMAQILYRLEKFEECFDLYRDIIKNTHDDYDDERTTNMSAVAANLCVEGSKKELPKLREDTYELTYNAACALAGKQQFPEAEKKLRTSEKLCREFLEEDGATEEDIMDEVAIIKVQLAYCLQMQGKSKEASAIYTDALKHKTNDQALTAVASNNLVVINKDQNMFDSKKKMKQATSEQAEHKLTSKQKKLIAFNNCLLALFTNQADCQLLASRLGNSYQDLEFQSLLIRVSQMAKDKKFKDAVELLQNYCKKQPKQELEVKFAIIQLQLIAGNRKAAVEILESLGEAKYRPGVVSALVTLYLGLDNKNAASNILKTAVEWYKKNKATAGGDLTDMWRQAASFHLRGGEAETAAKSLEELLRSNPTDMKILAQLVIAYAQFNPKKAQEASKKLPALETLATGAEIDALEATNWMMIAKAVKKKMPSSAGGKTDQSPGTPGSEITKQKKKTVRKRKGKLPKNYDASAVPDPERWLPRYERTGYRKKRDRRVKEVMKGSQGVSSGQADQYDMSKSYNQTKESPATPAANLPTGPAPRQLPRKSQHKKKKGKH
ncbi:signal recognition particle 72 kDa protein [Culex quinquefasciatus]|uniref:Signal recognition particle subunit SRP72 n=2 Tax=Culex quinquefasciatus TaxID=7176 RepID=B0XFF2_CULQU|nr:signal recognition particle subunit SRP72 [Culex quinquefasciatus]EDS26725.1 signal recognition particle 72 kDa protein [Culex quinquefasciatus]|eukprot:XP_001868374.1 signal recognition particle 72 kDa protein [Culex quinquefasciatus]